MRKILFRGFHPDENGTQTIILDGKKIKGEWIEGCYYSEKGTANGKSFIVVNDFGFLKVLPKTVCQFAKKDKNEKDAFEGDIVRIEGINGKCVIEYDEKMTCWFIRILERGKSLYLFNHNDFEVIGNIYEEVEE